jgi:hypothetical protein
MDNVPTNKNPGAHRTDHNHLHKFKLKNLARIEAGIALQTVGGGFHLFIFVK